MLSTIDNAHDNLLIKITSIKLLLSVLKDIDNKLCVNIEKVYNDYNLGTVNILSEYFSIACEMKTEKNDSLQSKKDYFFKEYYRLVKKENIITRIENIFVYIKKYVQTNKDSISDSDMIIINKNMKKFEKSSVKNDINHNIYDICQCKEKMTLDMINSIMICKKCGITKDLCGMVNEYETDTSKSKNTSSYIASKHCKYWVDRIQGKETLEISNIEDIITKLKIFIKRDRISNINYITNDIIRSYLKEMSETCYNEHIPLLIKLITGISPPVLSDYERELIYIYFDKIIHIFNEIKPKDKKNCSYHPYFIYKILENILPDGNRKIQILNCIHLQSRETLINNDILFKVICERIPEIKYKPTDRNLNKLY
jgi:hypothetical protein